MAQTNYTPISLYYSTTASTIPTNTNLVNGELAINITDGKLYYKDNTGTVKVLASSAGALGDVVGPASATDTAIALFDGTTGKLIKNSLVTIGSTGNTVISGTDNTNAMLRITQLGTGNALLVEDSANPDATPFVIDASGNVLSGYTTSVVNAGSLVAPRIQLNGSGGGGATAAVTSWAAGINVGGTLLLSRSEGSTVGTQTIVDSGDQIGKLSFAGSDGTAFIEAARIEAAVDGVPGTNDMPGRLVFSTTADGASTVTERLRITSTGALAVAGASNYGTSGQVLTSAGNAAPTWATPTTGTVTSVAQTFTGGIVSIAGSPITTTGTLALTVAGTSGGIPYFSSGTTWASSAALTANALVIGGGAGTAPSVLASGTSGQALISAGSSAPVFTDQFLSITYVFSSPVAGDQGDLTIPFGCTITEWTMLADVSGSAVIDIWKDTYANYPPTVADTITGSAKPTISAALKGQSSTLTGWTATITAGDTLRFNVDSVSAITRITLSLKVKRS